MGATRSKVNIRIQHQIAGGSSDTKTYKGLIDGDRYISIKRMKISSEEQELLIKKFILLRQTTEISDNTCLQSNLQEIFVETLIETSNNPETSLLIYSKYRNTVDLYSLISTSKAVTINPISPSEKAARISTITGKLILLLTKASNYQLYSLNTLLFQNNEASNQIAISINKTSMCGLKLVLNEEPISFQQFSEVYEILGSKILQQGKGNPLERFTIQLKIRAIGMVVISMILEKEVHLLEFETVRTDDKKKKVMSRYKKLLAQLPSKFEELLTFPEIKQQIERVEQSQNVRYYDFLWAVFVQEKELKWSEVVDLLCPKVTHLPSKKRQVMVAIPCQELSNMLISNLDQAQRTKMKDLGLTEPSQFHIHLITQLTSDELMEPERLLEYQDLNDFFYNSEDLDLKEKFVYYGNIMKMISKIKTTAQEQKDNEKWKQQMTMILASLCKVKARETEVQTQESFNMQSGEQNIKRLQKRKFNEQFYSIASKLPQQILLLGQKRYTIGERAQRYDLDERLIQFSNAIELKFGTFRDNFRGKPFQSRTRHCQTLKGFCRAFQ